MYWHGGLYLYARAEEHGEVRTFAVERIEKIEVRDETFEVPADFNVSEYARGAFGIAGGKPEPVEIAFEAAVAGYIRERVWHESQSLEEGPGDGRDPAPERRPRLRAQELDQGLPAPRPRDQAGLAARGHREGARAGPEELQELGGAAASGLDVELGVDPGARLVLDPDLVVVARHLLVHGGSRLDPAHQLAVWRPPRPTSRRNPPRTGRAPAKSSSKVTGSFVVLRSFQRTFSPSNAVMRGGPGRHDGALREGHRYRHRRNDPGCDTPWRVHSVLASSFSLSTRRRQGGREPRVAPEAREVVVRSGFGAL